MIGFLIKKTFFDAWDHMLTLVFLNLGGICFGSIALFALFISPSWDLSHLLLPGLLVLGFFAWAGTQTYLLTMIANFHSPRFSDLGNAIRVGWRPGIQFGISLSIIVFLAIVTIPFYLKMHSLFGTIAASLIFWCMFTVMLALQYLLPVMIMLKDSYSKAIKKCLFICFDNILFSLFLFVWTLILGVVSCCSAFTIPGLAGMQLATVDALKLRLYKYDWLERNPEAERNSIPWDTLLDGDREQVGTRSWKSLIFPWQD
jgi:hypothetical protein